MDPCVTFANDVISGTCVSRCICLACNISNSAMSAARLYLSKEERTIDYCLGKHHRKQRLRLLTCIYAGLSLHLQMQKLFAK